ncbi:hypothetical protein JL721_5000 [Aureococcus anophagefferens]|nr:hypothetical protein JL721_5000 [Aureococcus anophagefferens]
MMGSPYERLPGSAGRRAAAWVAPVLGLAILVAASVFDVDDVVARWFAAAPPSAAAPPTLAVRREDRSDYVGADSLYPGPTSPSRTARRHDFTVMVKYVRREIRALGDADREGFLGALHVVYHASDADGKRRYGSKFRSSTYLVKKHLYGAADRSCDHWHDDAGILNHHVAFTLELEQSLQAIDARVAVPYWDYTVDAATIDATPGSMWWDQSEIFTRRWFGAMTNLSSQHYVASGRWAYTAVPTSPDPTDERCTNAYGLLRSPWNSISDPFVTRSKELFGKPSFANFPGCDVWHRAFTSPTLAEVLQIMNGAAHGPVHIMVGGQWSTNATSWVDAFWAETITFPSDVLLFSKWLWRKGYVRSPAPSTCASSKEGVTEADCRCKCGVDVDAADFDAYAFLTNETDLTHWLAQALKPQFYYADGKWRVKDMSERQEADVWRTVVRALCDPQNTFVQDWRYEHNMAGGTTFITPPSDTGLVCDWSAVDADDAMPVCVRGTCPGHGVDDDLPFGNFTGAAGEPDPYTNLDFYEFSAPENDALPYMYDNFAYEHCAALGYDFRPAGYNVSSGARFFS